MFSADFAVNKDSERERKVKQADLAGRRGYDVSGV
jgi:hypothetical protein